MKTLFVIEAVGKLRAFGSGLRAARIAGDVVATMGHLYENPRTLRPIALARTGSGSWVETARRIGKPHAIARLNLALEGCTELVIATDPDQEGHAIANDVAGLALQQHKGLRISRMLPRSIDPSGLAAAYQDRDAWQAELGNAGTGRRIADRLIGAGLSDLGQGIVLGRVQTALLALCSAGAVSRREVVIPVASSDRMRPFTVTAEVPVGVSAGELAALADGLWIDATSAVPGTVAGEPLHCASALLQLESELGLRVPDAADLLQDLYEQGQLSYPRTALSSYSNFGADAVAGLAAVRGLIGFRRSSLPRIGDSEREAHEALRLVGSGVNLQKPLQLRPTTAEAALALVGRRSVEAGYARRIEACALSGAPRWLSSHVATRASGPKAPWATGGPQTARVTSRSMEAALVAAMHKTGIGRPSTYAAHAVKLAGSGLVDEQLRPTRAGERLLDHAPDVLKDSRRARDIEAGLAAARTVDEAVNAVLGPLDLLHLARNLPGQGEPQASRAEPETGVDTLLEEEADEPVYRFGI